MWEDRLLVADEFFLVAHNDIRGKARLHPAATGLGLAGGLLGELVLYGHIVVVDGDLSVVDRRPPADALAHTVLDQLVGEAQHRSVRTWLSFLAQSATTSVGERLSRAGVLRRRESRRLLRTTVGYVPVDPNAAAWPTTRLRVLLERSDPPPTLADAVLLGLIAAAGLDREVLWSTGPRAQHRLTSLVAALPAPLKELVAHTEAAVGAAVLRGGP
ncbi:GOLPH3/VPS74 family protein [Salinispora arenicola]|uniref:GOLPH3/VPS74 family protein n=1 Tax=Salinispora arenicola TaxID=168697 RepID=UPI00168FCA28|nr:GPP34 family phosphoprotein [Salinispora arenicola]NIL57255.1 GPP34 family phosphoprotein [Salinispora arenicola]NIL61360.1 GPP34 family phosphoprotein [Salinispora arenicola]